MHPAVWIITMALIVTLPGTRAAQENARAEIAAVTEECTNGFTQCFCNLSAIQDSLVCNLFSSFTANNNSSDSALSVPPETTKLTLNIVNDGYEDEVTIPSYLLRDDPVKYLLLLCQDKSFHLLADENAIKAIQTTLVSLEIRGCNLEKFNFAFLDGFGTLEKIKIDQSTFPSSATLESIPILASWHSLEITDCSGHVEWSSPPSIGAIIELNLENNMMGDDAVMDILDSVLTYNSILEVITLKNNSLTEVPELISSFPNLRLFDIGENLITHLPPGSLNVSSVNVTFIGLEYLPLSQIDPEAFQGYFNPSTISLRHNNLSYFDLAVFKNILDQMMESGGQIDLTGNAIECDCSLIWLIRDHRELLPRVSGGRCSNSTSFEELDPTGWACDETATLSMYETYTVVYEDPSTIPSVYYPTASDGSRATEEETGFTTIPTIDSNAIATTPLVDATSTDDNFPSEYTDDTFATTLSSSDDDVLESIIVSTPSETTDDSFIVDTAIFTSPFPLLMSSNTDYFEGTNSEESVDYSEVTNGPTTDYNQQDQLSYYLFEDPQFSTTTEIAQEFSSNPTLSFDEASTTAAKEYTSTTYRPEEEQDRVPSFRPYPIQITTEAPADYIAPSEDDFVTTTAQDEVSSVHVPSTVGPIADYELKSWLERNPFVGPLVITWLILLPIMLSSIVYICG